MLLAIDAGNTNIVFALYEGEKMRAQWRAVTQVSRTADEYGLLLGSLLELEGLSFADLDAAIIAMSRLPAGSLTPKLAGLILAAPILANTLVKAGLAFTIARGSAGAKAAGPLLVTFVAGLADVAALAVVF